MLNLIPKTIKLNRKKERAEGIVCYLDDVLSSVIAAMGLRLTMVSLWHTPWALSPWHWSTLAHPQQANNSVQASDFADLLFHFSPNSQITIVQDATDQNDDVLV